MTRSLVALALALCCLPVLAADLILSEYVEGSGNNRALEIYNPTPSHISASSYRIRVYPNGGTAFGQISLVGTIAPGGRYIVAQVGASPSIVMQANQFFSSATQFDGDDTIALVKVDGTFVDVLGRIGAASSLADRTLRRKSTICAGDANGSDAFDESLEWDTFPIDTVSGIGSHTVTCVPPDPPVIAAEIFQIQGSGASSPLAGQTVETRDNIVTAVTSNGFFLQTPDYRADASALTSNGIFVATGSAPAVSVFNQVDVKGRVTETGGVTQLGQPLTIAVDTSFMPLPAYTNATANFESLEGMLVRVAPAVAAQGTDASGATRIVSGSVRPFRGAPAEVFKVDPTKLGGGATLIGGAAITLAEGPLTFAGGEYVVWTSTLQFTNPPFPRPARARNAGEFTVAAQNLRAQNAGVAKLSTHIRQILGAPDVVAVSEIASLGDLAARLNADEGGLNYVPYAQGSVGFLVRDTIAVASVTNAGTSLLLRGSYVGNGAPFPIAVLSVHEPASIPALPDPRLIITGEFGNASIAGFTNHATSVAASDRYSFVDNGIADLFDYTLTSGLGAFTRGFQFTRANADAPASFAPASDHDGVVLFVMSDRDADGLADDADQCPAGDARPTVILGGCDSGAPNLTFPGGCTLTDQIAALKAAAKNHGAFLSDVSKLLKAVALSGAQKGAIESCAARWK
jgi:hypothetical protein